jgi:hypothetical protein
MDLGLGRLGPHAGTFAGGSGSGLGQNRALNRAQRPLGPMWPAQPAQRRPFSVFVLEEFRLDAEKKKPQCLGVEGRKGREDGRTEGREEEGFFRGAIFGPTMSPSLAAFLGPGAFGAEKACKVRGFTVSERRCPAGCVV